MAKTEVEMSKLIRQVTIEVHFSRTFMLRLKLALFLIKLGAKIGGFGYKEMENINASKA